MNTIDGRHYRSLPLHIQHVLINDGITGLFTHAEVLDEMFDSYIDDWIHDSVHLLPDAQRDQPALDLARDQLTALRTKAQQIRGTQILTHLESISAIQSMSCSECQHTSQRSGLHCTVPQKM